MSEKVHVARSSAIAGGLLALFKLGIGIFAGSLALLSEGIHSTLDFLVTLATLFSVKTADIPADREHHYGHGKIENLTAFAEALLLIVTALLIVRAACEHLLFHQDATAALAEGFGGWAAIGVVSLSIVVDLSRSRALGAAARKFKSQALEADALHFGTELLSSVAVLIGLILAKVDAQKFWIADPVAALLVALIMIITGLRLGRRSADVLVDRAPDGVELETQKLIVSVPGVRSVERVRARQGGARTFIDATITVDPAIDMSAGHEIADNVELRVTEKFPNLDILVHVEPAPPEADPGALVRTLADDMQLHVHAIRIRAIGGHLYVNFHAEFPPEMTLATAHERITALEEKIRKKLPAVAEVLSHIEPADPSK